MITACTCMSILQCCSIMYIVHVGLIIYYMYSASMYIYWHLMCGGGSNIYIYVFMNVHVIMLH